MMRGGRGVILWWWYEVGRGVIDRSMTDPDAQPARGEEGKKGRTHRFLPLLDLGAVRVPRLLLLLLLLLWLLLVLLLVLLLLLLLLLVVVVVVVVVMVVLLGWEGDLFGDQRRGEEQPTPSFDDDTEDQPKRSVQVSQLP